MGMTLSSVVKRTFSGKDAEEIQQILRESAQAPEGRITLYSMKDKGLFEFTIKLDEGDMEKYRGVPIQIPNQIPLEELCIAWKDLREHHGMTPDAFKPNRVEPNFSLYGVETNDSIALWLVDPERDRDLGKFSNLQRIPDFETYTDLLEHMIDTDWVTGLNSRKFLERKIIQYESIGMLSDFVCVMGDLDHFKSLNDRYGHAVGDKALRIMGEELTLAIGEDGNSSRKAYGDETMSLILKEHLQEHEGGFLGWAQDINHRLAQKSSRLAVPDYTIKMTFGVYPIMPGDEGAVFKRRADQALIYAKRKGLPIQVWKDDLPRHEEMQSDAHRRFQDPELMQVATSFNRAFKKGIRPEQVDPVREMLEEQILLSPHIREQDNKEVLDDLTYHLILTQSHHINSCVSEKVWGAIYLHLTSKEGSEGLTEREKELAGNPKQIKEALEQRLNLKHLLTDHPLSEEFNSAIYCQGIGCRYDDAIVNLEESASQSRVIVSGDDIPTSGSLENLCHLLEIISQNYLVHNEAGVIVLDNDDGQSIKLRFNKGEYDVGILFEHLDNDRQFRVQNYLGLDPSVKVTTTVADKYTSFKQKHILKTTNLALFEPVFQYFDELDSLVIKDVSPHRFGFGTPDNEGIMRVTIPDMETLILQRALYCNGYENLLPTEEVETSPDSPASCRTTRITRRPVNKDSTHRFIEKTYSHCGITSGIKGCNIYYGDPSSLRVMLSDLYQVRDLKLGEDNGEFIIYDLRLRDLETSNPQTTEVITALSRDVEQLLLGSKPRFTIQKGRSITTHMPKYIPARGLSIRLGSRHGELFGRYK